MQITQSIHDPEPSDVSVQDYEYEDASRKCIRFGPATRGVSIHGTRTKLVAVACHILRELLGYDASSTVEVKGKINDEPKRWGQRGEPEAHTALSRDDVIARLRGDYAKMFPDADDFSAGYVDFEQRKVLDALERLGLAIVEPRAGDPLRGDRTFSDDSREVTIYQAGGRDLVVEADGILASEAGDGHVVVAGRIVREIDGSLSTEEGTPPPSVRFELPETEGPTPEAMRELVDRIDAADEGAEVFEGGVWRPAQPGEVDRTDYPVGRTEPFADINRTTEPDLIADRREDEDGERI